MIEEDSYVRYERTDSIKRCARLYGETGRVLTDFEKATLIYNHSGMNHEEKAKALECLQEVTEDKRLCAQIQKRLAYDKQCLKKFYERAKDEVYVLHVFITEELEWEECGCFVSGETAVACGKKFKERFLVHKINLITEEKEPKECYSKEIAALCFNAGSKLCSYYSDEVIEDEAIDEAACSRFEDAYIDIPHPFKNGDLIRVKYSESLKDEICIVECMCEEPEDEIVRGNRCRYYDYGVKEWVRQKVAG